VGYPFNGSGMGAISSLILIAVNSIIATV
jgi:hypothetical protein